METAGGYFRLGRRSAVLLSMLALSACATAIKSTVDVADNADFAELNTYAWMTDQSTSEQRALSNNLNPLHEQRIRAAVEAELERKGYGKTTRDEADFVVFVRLAVTDHLRVREFYGGYNYNYFGYYPGYRYNSPSGYYSGYRHYPGYGYYPGLNRSSVYVQTVTEGNLVVDIFDNRSNEAIWHGSASKRLGQTDETVELIHEAVSVLLARFPDKALLG